MKNNRLLLVFGLLILVSIVGLLYFTKLNRDNNIKNNNLNNQNSNQSTSKEVIQRISIDVDSLNERNKDYTIKTLTGSSILQVKFPSENNESVTNLLTLGNKVLINNYDEDLETLNNLLSLRCIEIYNDIIIVYYTVGKTASIKIFNLDGQLLKDINKFKVNNDYYYVYATATNNPIELENNVIKFIGTKYEAGMANSYLVNENDIIDLCEKSDAKKYNVSDDDIVTAYFTISYDGNNTFSDIKYTETIKTVKEYKSCE